MFSSSRIKIEHAFGELVARWRFLWKHLYMLSTERMAKTILACTALHNICIDNRVYQLLVTEGIDDGMGFEEYIQQNSLPAQTNLRFAERDEIPGMDVPEEEIGGGDENADGVEGTGNEEEVNYEQVIVDTIERIPTLTPQRLREIKRDGEAHRQSLMI